MRKFTAALALTAATALAGTMLVAAPQTAVAGSPPPSLDITPADGHFTGGSQLTLTGHLGVSGRKRIRVQRNLNRVGDPWHDLPSRVPAKGWSNPDGSFKITAPAGDMWNIRYRVVSGNGKHVTPSKVTNAVAQEAILAQDSPAVAGRTFTMHVDTVGRDYTGHRDMPAVHLPGRNVTIERRVNPWTWQSVATGKVDTSGVAEIDVEAPSTVGVQTYRAKLEDWTGNGDQLGWTTSFPIDVRIAAGPHKLAPRPKAAAATLAEVTTERSKDAHNPLRRHAYQRYGWARKGQRFVYDWPFGESLSTTPDPRVSKLKRGYWVGAADGTGRVTRRNGGLLLSSDGYRNTRSVRGSVWATARDNGAKRGRWEFRGVTSQRSSGGKAYRVRYELVPDGTNQKCSPWGILVAQSTGPGKRFRFGVRNARGVRWARSYKPAATSDASSYAVQVTKKHITWFYNSKRIGTVRNKAAIPRAKLAPRISMVSRGDSQMRSTKSTVDWVRGFDLKTGKRPTSKRGLKKGAALPRC